MSDPMKQAWNDVAEGFSTLGRMMKERYHGASGDEPGAAATADGTPDARAALREAFTGSSRRVASLVIAPPTWLGTMTSRRKPSEQRRR
jgi:hypothetical protein